MDSSPRFDALAAACGADPPWAVLVLGSGLGEAVARVRVAHRVPYARVPGLAAATVPGHRGFLTLGDWVGRRLLILEGRLHYYEGHPWSAVVQPVRIAGALGARVALLTNAAGGIGDHLGLGSLMALRDHFEWNRPYPWRHPGPGGLGPPRPSPYSPRLLERLARAAQELNIDLPAGIYAPVTGPCYETPAEVRALRACGADAVGMSTTREAEVAALAGLECAGLSCITNRAAGRNSGPLRHDEVLAGAAAQARRVTDLLERFRALSPAG
jgi:purine-nucleoside phosphorylase